MQQDPVCSVKLDLISVARSSCSVTLLNVSQQPQIINKNIFEFYWDNCKLLMWPVLLNVMLFRCFVEILIVPLNIVMTFH